MGKLIDADKLIELMIRDRDYAGENGFMDMFYERQHLIGIINKQPTAYDVDKVVKQLRKLPKCSTWNHNSNNIDRDKAIEIVKGGGVKND